MKGHTKNGELELVGLEKIFDKYDNLRELKDLLIGLMLECDSMRNDINFYLTKRETINLKAKNEVVNHLIRLKELVHAKVTEIIREYRSGNETKANYLTRKLVAFIKEEFKEVRGKIE